MVSKRGSNPWTNRELTLLRELFPLGTRERVILELRAEGLSRSQIERMHWAELGSYTTLKLDTLAAIGRYLSIYGNTSPIEKVFPAKTAVKRCLRKIERKRKTLDPFDIVGSTL